MCSLNVCVRVRNNSNFALRSIEINTTMYVHVGIPVQKQKLCTLFLLKLPDLNTLKSNMEMEQIKTHRG